MKKNRNIIKNVIIGATMGAALLFGVAGMARAQENPSAEGVNESADTTAKARVKLTSPAKIAEAKSAVSVGYMEGFKYGQKDGNRSNKYKATIRTPNEDEYGSSASLSRNYKSFYEAGFVRGYEDGYKKTTKYGEISVSGGEKGFTVYAKVLDSLVGGPQ